MNYAVHPGSRLIMMGDLKSSTSRSYSQSSFISQSQQSVLVKMCKTTSSYQFQQCLLSLFMMSHHTTGTRVCGKKFYHLFKQLTFHVKAAPWFGQLTGQESEQGSYLTRLYGINTNITHKYYPAQKDTP